MSIFTNKKFRNIKQFLKRTLTETSPFDQLSGHAEKVAATVNALVNEIHQYTEGNPIEGKEVSNHEYEADKLKQEIRKELPRSDLLMPVARSDLLSLLWHQDEIADNSQDVAELLPLLTLQSPLPDVYRDTLDNLGDILEESVDQFQFLVEKSGEIIKGTTSGSDKLQEVWNVIDRINKLEHQADKLTRKAIKSAYNDDSLQAIEKYHLIQVALKTNNILDHIENAGNFIRIMTSK